MSENKIDLESLSEEEKEYYELLEDVMDDGNIDYEERSILDKMKKRYGISNDVARKLEDIVKSKFLSDSIPNLTNEEKKYYTLVSETIKLPDYYDDDNLSKSSRALLNKRRERYNISNDRANELEIECVKELIRKEENGWEFDSETMLEISSYPHVIKTIKFIIREYPKNISNYIFFADLEIKYGRNKKACKILEKALEIDNNNLEVLYLLSLSYVEQLDKNKALEYLEYAIELDPNNPKFLTLLGRCYNLLSIGEIGEELEKILSKSIDVLQKSLEIDDNNFDTLYWLGLSLKGLKNYELSIAIFNRALEIQPDNIRTLSILSESYMLNNQCGRAEEVIAKIIEVYQKQNKKVDDSLCYDIYLLAFHYERNNYKKHAVRVLEFLLGQLNSSYSLARDLYFKITRRFPN